MNGHERHTQCHATIDDSLSRSDVIRSRHRCHHSRLVRGACCVLPPMDTCISLSVSGFTFRLTKKTQCCNGSMGIG